jgi:DNA-binding CsgD family transcriptional regulator/tetratricopeptide (TPR) repeat protein
MDLLERTSFLRTLAEYAGEARQGSGRMVLVSGESGIGKTALLEEFQRQLPGSRWLWGACDGLLTRRPLGPLFDIGSQLDGELAELCRKESARDRLFTAFLAEIGSPGTVAVIEDVHWADEATIDLLSFVGRRLGRVPGLLLVTYRDDELGDDHLLRLVLGDLATQRATRRMRMPPLSVEAVRALVGQRDVDAAELHRVTNGNPFYVTEILAAGWPSVPPTVRDAVGARLARASAGTRRATETATVIGARVDRSLLPWLMADSGTSAEECVATGILVPDESGLRFRHELVRMAIGTGIPPHRKAELHARVLAELEGSDPAVLAYHADGAGDEDAVLRYAPEAARRSSALGAHREAAALYERALRVAHGCDTPTLAALHEGLAGEYSLLDRWEEAEAALRTALALRRETADMLSVGKLLRSLSVAAWRLCRGEDSRRAGEEAVQVLEALPPGEELAWAYVNKSADLMIAGQREAAFAVMDKARELGESLGRPEIVSRTLNSRGLCLIYTGIDGTETLERAVRLALDADLPEAAGLAYSSLVEGAALLNRHQDSERYYAEGMAYCDGRELGVFSTCMNGWRARTLMLLGRWDEAAEICVRALGHQGISPVNRLNPLCVLGTIRARRGEDGAWELLDEALALAERAGELPWVALARAGRAELRWALGEPDLAAAEARSGLDQALGRIDPWTLGSVAIWLPRLNAPGVLPSGLPEPYVLEIAGDWRGAAAAWERLSRPHDAALARLGSADEAGLREALLTFEGLGARTCAAAARRRMKDAGLRAIPRGPRPATRAAPAGLTAREQEVLALLVDGLADREIAQRLFISERTVQHHVSAVLAKIGVSSRTAAAREAARLGLGR